MNAVRHRVRDLTDAECWAIALEHRDLVRSRALRVRSLQCMGIDRDDLIQEGMLGLFHAVELFEEWRGVAFPTYATYWIDARIRGAVRDRHDPLRVPRYLQCHLRKLGDGRENLEDLTPDLRERIEAAAVARAAVAYTGQTPLGAAFLNEVECRPDVPDPDPGLPIRVKDAVDRLDDRERTVLLERSGLNDSRSVRTLRQVSTRLGVCQSSVQRIYATAIRKVVRMVGATPSREDEP